MKEHIKIILLTTILSFFLAPIISATYIGIITGEPLIITYPAVIPVALFVGGPFALLGALIFIFIGIKKIGNTSQSSTFIDWLLNFGLWGVGFGVVSSLFLWLLYNDGNSNNVFVGLKFIVPNVVITSTLMSIILAKIWHRYDFKMSA